MRARLAVDFRVVGEAALAAKQRVVRHHVSYSGPIVIDARMKPWFPKEVEADPETAALVTRRWKQYFPHRRVEMGDSHRGHLA